MKILVTGGAGYIGSTTVKALIKAGHEVVVFDNLSQGHKEVISVPLVVGDLLDKKSITDGLSSYAFDAVIHFAAKALAGESMKDPAIYFQNNIQGGLNLLEYMKDAHIPYIVFSSTCAIYGTPAKLPVTEEESKKPESVYGESKYMFESVLKWYDTIYGIKHVNLRYFNAAGASLDGTNGEMHSPETHIIPIAIQAAKAGLPFKIFGNNYATPDGSCIRDYIHIEDLAIAHIQALAYLQKENTSESCNLGTGQGYSNIEVVNMVKEITGKDLSIEVAPRRPGDPAIIYADNSKAKRLIGFNPQHSDLKTIVKTAWEWHKSH